MEAFKKNLDKTTKFIEGKLNNKVDQLGLDSLATLLEGRISEAMMKKLEYDDLKKNNRLIDKKIDLIENKISRVLIDTLIELQNEEVPLIVKQSNLSDKCMSCNQFIPNKNNQYLQNGEANNNTKSSIGGNIKIKINNSTNITNMSNLNTNETNEKLITNPSVNVNTKAKGNKKLEPLRNNNNILMNSTSNEIKKSINKEDLSKMYNDMVNKEVRKNNLDGNILMKKVTNFIDKKIV